MSTEHGRLAAAQSQSHEQDRRIQRNSSSAASPSALPNILKQECDSLNPSSSGLTGSFTPYIPQMYRPFDATRTRKQRSPFSEPETRQSVLRDGSRGSTENSGKRLRYDEIILLVS